MTMVEGFEITFPSGTSRETVDAIVSDVRAIGDEVGGAGTRTTKGPVTDTILAWVQVASPVVGVAGAVTGVVSKVVELIRGSGVSGAVLTLPDGGVVQVDHASAEDIERLVRVVVETQESSSH
jgi:hypothetical protein